MKLLLLHCIWLNLPQISHSWQKGNAEHINTPICNYSHCNDKVISPSQVTTSPTLSWSWWYSTVSKAEWMFWGRQGQAPTLESRGCALCRADFWVVLFLHLSSRMTGVGAPAASVDTQAPQSRKLILWQMCRLCAASRPYRTPPPSLPDTLLLLPAPLLLLPFPHFRSVSHRW